MIWFACKQCGKVHGRAENSIGALIFCECGQGLTVPWESTVAEPEKAAPAPVLVPAQLEPTLPDRTTSSSSPPPRSKPRKRPERRPADPHYCFNHDTLASVQTCADCGEAFCGACLVQFQQKTMCGPCKNFRVRVLQKPPRLSGLALVSLILALFTGPLGLCILPLVPGTKAQSFPLLALLPHVVAMALGGAALYYIEKDRRSCGQALALTAMVTASVAALLTLILTWYAPRVGLGA